MQKVSYNCSQIQIKPKHPTKTSRNNIKCIKSTKHYKFNQLIQEKHPMNPFTPLKIKTLPSPTDKNTNSNLKTAHPNSYTIGLIAMLLIRFRIKYKERRTLSLIMKRCKGRCSRRETLKILESLLSISNTQWFQPPKAIQLKRNPTQAFKNS